MEQKYDESNEVLARLNPKRLNPYERALGLPIPGLQRVRQGADRRRAIELLRKAIDEKVGEAPSSPSRTSATSCSRSPRCRCGRTTSRARSRRSRPGSPRRRSPAPSAYFTLAIAYYQLKDLDAALEPAKKAVELAETPQQGWLQLLLAIYLTKEDYASATPVLVELLTPYPDVGKAYWLQLATLYGVQKDIPRALAVMQLAHRRSCSTRTRTCAGSRRCSSPRTSRSARSRCSSRASSRRSSRRRRPPTSCSATAGSSRARPTRPSPRSRRPPSSRPRATSTCGSARCGCSRKTTTARWRRSRARSRRAASTIRARSSSCSASPTTTPGSSARRAPGSRSRAARRRPARCPTRGSSTSTKSSRSRAASRAAVGL